MNKYRANKTRSKNARRWQIGGVAGVAVVMVGVGLGVASAATNAAVPTVNCPQVNVNVAIPAQAKNEVASNLALLQTQIAEANKRLVDTVGQGGKNFIQNAILGPLADKRFATINRIETAIGRNAAKPDLNAEGLKTCTLNQAAAGAQATTAAANNGNNNAGNNNAGNNNAGNNAGAAAGDVSNAGKVGKAGTAGNGATTSDLGKIVNGQTILTDTCVDSKLQPADGFQNGNRCVSTEFGEVGSAANNPSLLITSSPPVVKVNTAFTIQVSTRNLVRDRFLGAGVGGYYVESSVLKNGLVRGHFHTACRMLDSTKVAPAPDPVPAFFVATEDNKGGRTPDTVTIQVSGMPTAGTAQCASWAGDGSHRVPMMQRANQTPALDAVRIRVVN